jgi:hypothetical protein
MSPRRKLSSQADRRRRSAARERQAERRKRVKTGAALFKLTLPEYPLVAALLAARYLNDQEATQRDRVVHAAERVLLEFVARWTNSKAS